MQQLRRLSQSNRICIGHTAVMFCSWVGNSRPGPLVESSGSILSQADCLKIRINSNPLYAQIEYGTAFTSRLKRIDLQYLM